MSVSYKEPYVNRRDYLLHHLEDIDLTYEELLVVMIIDYFECNGLLVTHEIIAKKLKKTVQDIDKVFQVLSQKEYLKIEVRNGKAFFNVEAVFASLDEEPVDLFNQDIFSQFESSFKKPLSQREYETLATWLQEYDHKLMLYALREAEIQEKVKFPYIEKILVEWKKKGLQPSDYEKGNY